MADFERIVSVDLMIPNNSSVHEMIPKPKYASYSMTRTLALNTRPRDSHQRRRARRRGHADQQRLMDNPKARGEVDSHIPTGGAA